MNAKAHFTKSFGSALVLITLLPGCQLPDWLRGKAESDKADVKKITKDASDVAALGKQAKDIAKTMPDAFDESDSKTHYQQMTGDVIATIGGKPLVTTGMVEAKKEQIMKANPQEFQAMMSFMDPKALDKLIAANLAQQVMIDNYISDQKIDQSNDYKEELAEGYKTIKAMVNEKHFTQKFPVTVSDAEIKEFYEKNKELIPSLMLSPGGVVATGISYDSESAAQEFMTTLKQNNGDFKKAAQAAGATDKIKDFRLVHGKSVGIDPMLRDKIIEIKKAPAVELIPVNGAFWVVNATLKEEAKYRPLEQIKDGIKAELEKQKRNEKVGEQLEILKKKYDVVLSEDYFKGGEEGMPDIDEEALMEQMLAAQGPDSEM